MSGQMFEKCTARRLIWLGMREGKVFASAFIVRVISLCVERLR